LVNDPTYQEIVIEVKSRQTAVFLSPTSSPEDREQAHAIIRALSKIDECIRSLHNAAVVELKRK